MGDRRGEPIPAAVAGGRDERRGGGPSKGPMLLLVGVLAGALIALVAFLVVDRDSEDGTPVAAEQSTAAETTAPTDEERDGTEQDGAATAGDPVTTPAPGEPTTPGESDMPGEPTPPGQPATPPQPGENMIAPAAGNYGGQLVQRGPGQSDYAVDVRMSFSSAGSGVSYPNSGCRGALIPTGDQGGARVYREEIYSGACDPTGTWLITRGSDTGISAEYQPPAGEYIVEGRLTR
ncbi:hypothetical protein K3888_02310 [Dietzia aurantiaca]|uniref:hypothetical protein n=1 Tax=Dietzia aurantiaca TaxID=983873 RepID=UPI001E56C67D|nr:hypothetical protein [Dietzia aurantiaca]MCD2261525.1 hypothetical protein [Dietzia aurantiaca]